MVRRITESLKQTDIRDMKTFSVLNDKVWVQEDLGDGLEATKYISGSGEFETIEDLLYKLNKQDPEIPIVLSDFDNIDFYITSSRLHMFYTTEGGVVKALALSIYENPCWMSRNSLKDYNIIL